MTPEHRDALKQAVDSRVRELEEAPADGINHGEYAYRQGCRCEMCKRAANDQRRRRINAMTPEKRRAANRRAWARKKERLAAAKATDNTTGRIVAA